MENIIQVKNLTKNYGNILALDHISFNVKKGEIFGLLGPNGAGKTTTIRILTGLSKPTDGEAYILNMDVKSQIAEIKKHIGVVPDVSNLYDELSAMDNLIFMAQLYGVPRHERKARAEELLKTFRLYERRNDLFRNFSRGMKRALTIAAGLIHEPEILFMDEPTVGLDVVAARSLRNLIKNLRYHGITIFLTTHYLEEADMLCNNIAILVKGKIIKIDTPNNLKAAAQEKSIIEISFDDNPSKFIEMLVKKIPEIKVAKIDDKKIRIYGGNPDDIYINIAKLKNGIKIESINTIKPSLEDAFIKMTGLSPVVMAIERGKNAR